MLSWAPAFPITSIVAGVLGLGGIAGWPGANLVFDHQIGIVDEDGD